MERLWAPWRSAYIKTTKGVVPENFIVSSDLRDKEREDLVIYKTGLSIVLLNRYPYNNGHLLVAPRREVAELALMSDDELLDCQKVIRDMVVLLKKILNCDGCNIGLNLGKAAGAGLPQHLHWHIVPRWNGDTNFMSTVADSRVIVQALDELWLQMRKELGLPV